VPAPLVVGIGGSNRAGSLTERLLVHALDHAAGQGMRTKLFGGDYLSKLAIYGSSTGSDPSSADLIVELVKSVSEADGLILASPGYHGGLSGLVKNGLDHLEELREDRRPYLDGRPVGTIISAAGWQACGTALVSLRSTVHSLRGWPTPFGATINSVEPVEFEDGTFNERTAGSLRIVADQVVSFLDRGRAKID
jgi:FMN reductase